MIGCLSDKYMYIRRQIDKQIDRENEIDRY